MIELQTLSQGNRDRENRAVNYGKFGNGRDGIEKKNWKYGRQIVFEHGMLAGFGAGVRDSRRLRILDEWGVVFLVWGWGQLVDTV